MSAVARLLGKRLFSSAVNCMIHGLEGVDRGWRGDEEIDGGRAPGAQQDRTGGMHIGNHSDRAH